MTTNVFQLRQLWQEAFEDPEDFLDLFFAAAYAPSRCHTISSDGKIVSALYWLDCSLSGEKIAYLYAVATAAPFRGRGLCHRLMEETHARLAQAGYAGSILVPGEASLFSFYAGMGYESCCRLRQWECHAGTAPVAIRQIGALEYAALRRALLPTGGVLQEGENLALLEKTVSFYAGADFLLAAAPQEDTLQGPELLGNTAQAPGILNALGKSSGRFRAPGNDRAFAMYRPIRPIQAPDYFAFSFE